LRQFVAQAVERAQATENLDDRRAGQAGGKHRSCRINSCPL